MYLIDTNVISELRKKSNANIGVLNFFKQATEENLKFYLSAITIGELRRGVEKIRHRNDLEQSSVLEKWLEQIISDYSNWIINFSELEAQVWGALRVPNHENSIDKQIAATALVNNLTLVTRNTSDFEKTGVKLLNPFEASAQ